VSRLSGLVARLAPRHKQADVEAHGPERERALAARERTTTAAINDAQAAHHESQVALDRVGRLLVQARLEAEALGGPPVPVAAASRRRRPRSTRDLCAASG